MGTINLWPFARELPCELPVQDSPAFVGGEGQVFFSCDGRYVAKVYHREGKEKRERLTAVLNLGAYLDPSEAWDLAWPIGMVTSLNARPCLGVVTRRAPRGAVPLVNLVLPEAALRRFRGGLQYRALFRIARATARAVRAIGEKGVVHGDLHYRNVLADPSTGGVTLIDLDGLIVEGFLAPQVAGMMGFMAPEIVQRQARPSELSDRHSLAVLLLHVLLLRNVMQPLRCHDATDEARDELLGFGKFACFSEDPRDDRNRPAQLGLPFYRGGKLSYRTLTPRLQELAERALVHGLRSPPSRPTPGEWEAALADSAGQLQGCAECRQDFLYPAWLQPALMRRCPFCGRRAVATQGAAVGPGPATVQRGHANAGVPR
jgi:DNA-binding helix-hairpin-helix protein with protein kinase domain